MITINFSRRVRGSKHERISCLSVCLTRIFEAIKSARAPGFLIVLIVAITSFEEAGKKPDIFSIADKASLVSASTLISSGSSSVRVLQITSAIL